MTKRLFWVLGLALILALLAGSNASYARPTNTVANLKPLIGNWMNVDPNTTGITRIVIGESGGGLTVHVWGKCHPTDCDWGEVPAIPYAKNVSARKAKAFTALYNPSFAERILTGWKKGKERVEVNCFTEFTDASGRSNYFSTERFAKQ